MSLSLTEADIDNRETLAEKLCMLAEIVISRHAYASMSRYFEDLRSVAVLRALEVIDAGYYDSGKGNFATLMYTAMRNAVCNYLYHENKGELVEIGCADTAGFAYFDKYFSDDGEVFLSYSLIHTVCLYFSPIFGDSLEGLVIHKLEDLGFNIVGQKDSSTVIYTDKPCAESYGRGVEDSIISRTIGIILWKRKTHDIDKSLLQ